MIDPAIIASSKEAARAALYMCLSADREQEKLLQAEYLENGIKTAAVNFGGEFIVSMNKIIERAVVASKREGVIGETHQEEGAVAGATHEALIQMMNKAMGMNVGGKLGIARAEGHVVVATFFGIGLLHLNEVAVGLGHRAL
nr:HutP family protein [bacterium]